MLDLEALSWALEAHPVVVRVVLVDVRGSTPRGAGTAMLIWDDGASGTIGGGRLEWEVTTAARDMLAIGATEPALRTFALGPALNQCCGGAVTVVLERWDAARFREMRPDYSGIHVRPVTANAGDMPPILRRKCEAWAGRDTPLPITLQGGWLAEAIWRNRRPVYIYGAGHVGHALARVLHPMPDLEVIVSDARVTELAKLPDQISVTASPPAQAVMQAPDGAAHLIMTHDHDLDLALCHGLLGRSFAYAGLIGSATKWARFRSRLAALGHADADISRITCPIGDPALGKHPQAIAVGVAAQLLKIKAPKRAMGDEFA